MPSLVPDIHEVTFRIQSGVYIAECSCGWRKLTDYDDPLACRRLETIAGSHDWTSKSQLNVGAAL